MISRYRVTETGGSLLAVRRKMKPALRYTAKMDYDSNIKRDAVKAYTAVTGIKDQQ